MASLEKKSSNIKSGHDGESLGNEDDDESEFSTSVKEFVAGAGAAIAGAGSTVASAATDTANTVADSIKKTLTMDSEEVMERKLLNKKQAKKQANGKQLNAEDAARLAYLKAKNKAAKAAAAAANDANDSSEEIVFDHSRSSSTGHGATKVRSDNTDSHGASATKSAATEAKAQLNERGQQLNGLSDKTADLASAAGEFEAMCKELRRKS